MCFKYIKYTINEKVFAKHRKIKEDINNKRFPVRDISVNFRFGLHFLPTTVLPPCKQLEVKTAFPILSLKTVIK
jgi:hypothetical protein